MESAAASLHPDVDRASSRAYLALYALGCSGAFASLSWIVFALRPAPDQLLSADQLFDGVLSFVPNFAGRAVGFFATVCVAAWALLATRNTSEHLRGKPLLPPGLAALSFCVPLVNLVLPFLVVRTLVQQSDPTKFAPVQRAVQTAPENYRDGGARLEVVSAEVPRAPLVAWWAVTVAQAAFSALLPIAARFFGIGSLVLGPVGVLHIGLAVAAAVLGMQTIRAVDHAQRERAARIAHLATEPAAA